MLLDLPALIRADDDRFKRGPCNVAAIDLFIHNLKTANVPNLRFP